MPWSAFLLGMTPIRYSQNDEQDHVLKFFEGKPAGRWLDLGAYDGRAFSNTLALAELGWGGVCVEPSPGPFLGLLKLHGQRSDIQIVQAAISEKDEWLTFHDSGGDAISTLSIAHRVKWETGFKTPFTPFQLRAVTMAQLLAKFSTDFAFINLDVEGTNLQLFKQLPFDAPALKLICVEHDYHHDEMGNIAAAYGFKTLTLNGENLLLCRE